MYLCVCVCGRRRAIKWNVLCSISAPPPQAVVYCVLCRSGRADERFFFMGRASSMHSSTTTTSTANSFQRVSWPDRSS